MKAQGIALGSLWIGLQAVGLRYSAAKIARRVRYDMLNGTIMQAYSLLADN
jgi:hypothetical protein